MKPPNLSGQRAPTIAFLMEVVLAIGVGLSAARLHREAIRFWFSSLGREGDALLPYRIFLIAFAATLGVGLAVGSAWRRRGPADWGPGRWTIATSGFLGLAVLAEDLATMAIHRYRGKPLPGFEEFVGDFGLSLAISFAYIPYILVALWLTTRASGRRLIGTLDAREWAGRLIAGAFVATAVVRLWLR